MSKTALGISALAASALIWGITIPLMKVNLDVFPPLTLAFLRFTPAAFFALYFVQVRKVNLKDIVHIGIWSFVGISLNLSLLIIGLQYISTIDATLLLTLGPVITSILATFTLREKIITSHVLGIILSMCGVLLYTAYPLFNGGSLNLNFTGYFLITLAIIFGSMYMIGSKKLFSTYHPTTIAGVSFLVGALSFLPGSVWELWANPGWFGKVTLFNWVSLAFLSVGSSFLAFLFLEWGLKKVAVHISAVIGYLTPALSIVIAATFLGEQLNPSFLFSIILVVLGIFLVTKTTPHHTHHRIHKV